MLLKCPPYMPHHQIAALPCSKEKGHLVGLKLTDKIPFISQGHTPSFLRFLLDLLLISSNTPRFRAAIFTPRSSPHRPFICPSFLRRISCDRQAVHIFKNFITWACSSAGRAFGSHPRGREFESLQVHQISSLFFMRSEDFCIYSLYYSTY